MLNSELPPAAGDRDEAATRAAGLVPVGSALVAGLATAIVLAIWLGFYFLIFVPRTVH
jgi:hypothetical protein